MPHENVHVHPRPSRICCCRAGTCWARAGTNVNVFSGALFTSVSYVEQDGGLPAPPTVRALDEAVDGQDVAVGRSDVLLVRTISANAVDERLDHGPVYLLFCN